VAGRKVTNSVPVSETELQQAADGITVLYFRQLLHEAIATALSPPIDPATITPARVAAMIARLGGVIAQLNEASAELTATLNEAIAILREPDEHTDERHDGNGNRK
jgi:hypothetical protein